MLKYIRFNIEGGKTYVFAVSMKLFGGAPYNFGYCIREHLTGNSVGP